MGILKAGMITTIHLDMGILKAGMITTIHMDIAKKKDNQTGFYIAKKSWQGVRWFLNIGKSKIFIINLEQYQSLEMVSDNIFLAIGIFV
jgi:hypothetical protein